MILCGDFSTALLRLKDGYRVRRERWDDPKHVRAGSVVEFSAGEFWRVKDLARIPYTPTTDDMTATDWQVVD